MSINFLAQSGSNAIAIVRHGWSLVYDRAAMALCRDHLRDVDGNPPDDEKLSTQFGASFSFYSSAPTVMKAPRILLGFDISPEQIGNFGDIDLPSKNLKGTVCYTRFDEDKYLISNLCTSEDYQGRGMGTHLILAALQAIQDECVMSHRDAVTIKLDCTFDKIAFYARNGFSIREREGDFYHMERILHKDEILSSCWEARTTPPFNPPSHQGFPSRTVSNANRHIRYDVLNAA